MGLSSSRGPLSLRLGARYNKPTAVPLDRFVGRGIHYGATYIEAQLCEGEEVIVVGGGNSAGQAAVFLSQTARKVYMLVRGPDLAESMSRYLIQRISGNPSIELLCNSELSDLEGEGDLEKVTWINRMTGQMRSAAAHHLFIMAGASPNTDWLEAVSLLMRRASSSPGAICHWLLTQIGILLGRFRARLKCWRAACQEYSRWAMSGLEVSRGWLRPSAKDLRLLVWCIELSLSFSRPDMNKFLKRRSAMSDTGTSTDAGKTVCLVLSRGRVGRARGSSIRNLIEVGNGDRHTRGASRAAKGGPAWAAQ